jgi:TonB-dependent SusC/RagA subfamily outer membrane receptor
VGETNTAGGVPGFTIRGTNTIAASSAPLIVLDGVIFSGSMADIAPSDVESVTVLKDASAAAVYGARSANGVIIIESKKGTSVNGKPKFDLRTSYGSISELKPLEIYNAQGYMQRLNDILNDNGTVVPMDQTPNYLQNNEKVNYNKTPEHTPTLADPYSVFSQPGYNFNTSMSLSQRTDKFSYFLSGNYTDQKGGSHL